MNPKQFINQPVSFGGKIGIITDVFSNDKDEYWVTFESAESIIRSKFGLKRDEFVPFSDYLVKKVSLEELLSDIENKKKCVKTELAERIRAGIEAIAGAKRTMAYINDMDAAVLLYEDESTLVVRDVYGTPSVVLHRRLYTEKPPEQCKEIVEKRYGGTATATELKLDEFAEFAKYTCNQSDSVAGKNVN